ncbi:MAG: hypothetical protein Q8R63_04150 [Ramlibacter sp.]|nr:hypothetical protein [Ramlibacter sp.]
MNRFISPRIAASAALALGIVGAASAAHARSDVVFSIGIQPAPGYYQQAPVYVQPQAVYSQPRPVYVQPAYAQPVYVQPAYRNDWGHQRHARNTGPWGDIDRDGIRNRDDRDRDGDGIRNRNDRFPDNPYRR